MYHGNVLVLPSQEFPALANLCDVLLNCLPLAPLIKFQAVLLQRLKRYLWVGVALLPKAELFFPPLLFSSTLFGPALQPLDGASAWVRGSPVSQSRAHPVEDCRAFATFGREQVQRHSDLIVFCLQSLK